VQVDGAETLEHLPKDAPVLQVRNPVMVSGRSTAS
jgi:hypothetical protein